MLLREPEPVPERVPEPVPVPVPEPVPEPVPVPEHKQQEPVPGQKRPVPALPQR